MLDQVEKKTEGRFPLGKRDQRIYWVDQHVFDQQMYIYQNKVHSCNDRIVNIYQPQIRPMVRGKEKINVEFGSKINIKEVEGFIRLDHIGWDHYDEGGDLSFLELEVLGLAQTGQRELIFSERPYPDIRIIS